MAYSLWLAQGKMLYFVPIAEASHLPLAIGHS